MLADFKITYQKDFNDCARSRRSDFPKAPFIITSEHISPAVHTVIINILEDLEQICLFRKRVKDFINHVFQYDYGFQIGFSI